ncbi:DUF881 domain-containing protein [Peribacillus muralis]|uniref:DUF881 domain-containing protein n=1 Tax=Peribacillus muralis TaxID=264697 RepID=UPI001F4D43AB|nr:DUF881 domain-containing protein [Peribacillus muralis]MCK1992565.1 DUF881 domain-containing protein [Peribacillus muralis]MCK2013121.1 DUF881 domain-containing protein [Peribacillus muralis]
MKKKLSFSLLTLIAGFMLAIQFNLVNQPVVSDTRDMWELKNDLLKEQQTQVELIDGISKLEGKIASYETKKNESKEEVLRDTLKELKAEAGLTEIKGKGVIVSIQPSKEGALLGERVEYISPVLLIRLVNEMYRFGADDISIAGQRDISSSVIRDINGQPKMDGVPLNDYPLELQAITDDPKKLKQRIEGSELMDDFFIDNFEVQIKEPIGELTLPSYQNDVNVERMTPIMDEGGS